jgi:hypothetical protein
MEANNYTVYREEPFIPALKGRGFLALFCKLLAKLLEGYGSQKYSLRGETLIERVVQEATFG